MISWQTTKFPDLTASDLYEILHLRQQVFILEQQCLYPDIDGTDTRALHLRGRTPDGTLLAYARLFAPTPGQPACIIGRILTSSSARGSGVGGQLLSRALDEARQRFPDAAVELAAQAYLTSFYARFGFQITSEPYDEDGIAHVDMRLSPSAGR